VESQRELQDLADDCPGIEFMQLPAMGSSGWVALAAWLRRSIDYLRYLEPRYPAETRLRTRAARKAPSATRTMARGAKVLGAPARPGSLPHAPARARCRATPPALPAPRPVPRPDDPLPAPPRPTEPPPAASRTPARDRSHPCGFPARGWEPRHTHRLPAAQLG